MLDTVSTHTKAYPPEQHHEEPPHVQLTFDLDAMKDKWRKSSYMKQNLGQTYTKSRNMKLQSFFFQRF